MSANRRSTGRWALHAARLGTLALAGSLLVAAVPERSVAQVISTDSLVTLLSGQDWPTREAALTVVRRMSPPLPQTLSTAIVAVVKQTALTPGFGAESEDYGEYLVDLAVGTTKTGDKSAIPALVAIGGLGVSTGTAVFIASAGPAILPLLDSVQNTSPVEAGTVVEAIALMYTQQGALRSASDSAAIFSRLVAAASSPQVTARQTLPYVALRIPLPELVPVLQVLAASDTFAFQPEGAYPVRLAAQLALDTLGAAWNALTPSALLGALSREQPAACVGAVGELFGHCQSMTADLATATAHVSDANAQPSRSAVDRFRQSLQQASLVGLSPLATTLLDVNALRLLRLLPP